MFEPPAAGPDPDGEGTVEELGAARPLPYTPWAPALALIEDVRMSQARPYCGGCGTPRAAGMRFCEGCGSPFDDVDSYARRDAETIPVAHSTGSGEPREPVRANRSPPALRPAHMMLVAALALGAGVLLPWASFLGVSVSPLQALGRDSYATALAVSAVVAISVATIVVSSPAREQSRFLWSGLLLVHVAAALLAGLFLISLVGATNQGTFGARLARSVGIGIGYVVYAAAALGGLIVAFRDRAGIPSSQPSDIPSEIPISIPEPGDGSHSGTEDQPGASLPSSNPDARLTVPTAREPRIDEAPSEGHAPLGLPGRTGAALGDLPGPSRLAKAVVFCPYCGSARLDGARLCAACGENIGALDPHDLDEAGVAEGAIRAADPEVSQPAEAELVASPDRLKRRRWSHRWLVAVLGGACLALALGVGAMLLSSREEPGAASSSPAHTQAATTAPEPSAALDGSRSSSPSRTGEGGGQPGATPLAGVLDISSGGYHICAVRRADGAVRCWGATSSGASSPPADLGPASAVSAGKYHTCAIRRADGTVRCWGIGFDGSSPPADLGPARAVGAGQYHNCAIRAADGTVRCWGSYASPPPADLGPVSAISAGQYHDCAIRAADGTVRCWGTDRGGASSPPADLGPVSAISAGQIHTCAVRAADGTVRCWGHNRYGQSSPPADLGPASAVSSGYLHTCAVRVADGTVRCWGNNDDGQASPPADLGPASAVSSGYLHTCAVRRVDGTVRCWGSNDAGQASPPADLADS